MRLLLTRPLTDDDPLEAMLRAAGHDLLREPLLTLEHFPPGEIGAAGLQAVVATSANALRGWVPAASIAGKPFFAVGGATARSARQAGFGNVTAGEVGAQDLAAMLLAHLDPAKGRIVYLRGEDVAYDLEGPLRAAGFFVDSRRVYQAAPVAQFSPGTLAALNRGQIGGVVLLSPRTTQSYLRLINQHGLHGAADRLTHFCLSERVAAQLTAESNAKISIPARPNLQELVALVSAQATQSGPTV